MRPVGAAWRVSRATVLLVAALAGGVELAASAAAQVSVPLAATGVFALSPGRLGAIVAGLTGLVGLVNGGLALARGAGRSGTANRRRGAVVALVLGPIAVILGGLVVVTADGGIGTGNGLGGGIVAMVVGLIGMSIGGLALARSRRTG